MEGVIYGLAAICFLLLILLSSFKSLKKPQLVTKISIQEEPHRNCRWEFIFSIPNRTTDIYSYPPVTIPIFQKINLKKCINCI